jgi:o-succinylbenzoate---CoA ligase
LPSGSEVPDLVADWLAAWARDDPQAPALRTPGGSWTVAALDRAVDGLAGRLANLDVRPGAAIATLVEDDGPAVLVIHAARRLGAVLVPLNRRAAIPELIGQLRAAAPALLVHDEPNEARASEIAIGASVAGVALEGVLAGPGEPGAETEGPLSGAGVVEDPVGPLPSLDLRSLATIVFTSGTTGRPRGVPLSHAHHAASADAWAAVLEPRATDRWLVCLPLFHVAGLAIVVRASRWRVPLEVLPRFRADEVAARMAAGISHLSLVPTQLEEVLEAWGPRPVPGTLRAILLGGAPIAGPTLARARRAGLPVLTTYGLTETASGIAVGGAEAATLADPTALRPLPSVRLRILDPDPADGVGQVEVQGPMVFSGYLGDPAATAERLSDGWLRTGDLGSLDADGLLRVADRRDDLIVSGGENVYPAEVEAVLREHSAVVEAAVVGAPDATWGSVPVAAVVLASGIAVGDDELERHCRERLAGYKVPERFHRLLTLPRNEAGKVLRRELREMVAEPPA